MRAFIIFFLLTTMGNAMDIGSDASKNISIAFKELKPEPGDPFTVKKFSFSTDNMVLSQNLYELHLLKTDGDHKHSLFKLNIENGFLTYIRELNDHEKELATLGTYNEWHDDIWKNHDVDISNFPVLYKDNIKKIFSLGFYYLVIPRFEEYVLIYDGRGQLIMKIDLDSSFATSDITIFSNGDFAIMHDLDDVRTLYYAKRQVSAETEENYKGIFDAIRLSFFDIEDVLSWEMLQRLIEKRTLENKRIERKTLENNKDEQEVEIKELVNPIDYQFPGTLLQYFKDPARKWTSNIWRYVRKATLSASVRSFIKENKLPDSYADKAAAANANAMKAIAPVIDELFYAVAVNDVEEIERLIHSDNINLWEASNEYLVSPWQYALARGHKLLALALVNNSCWKIFYDKTFQDGAQERDLKIEIPDTLVEILTSEPKSVEEVQLNIALLRRYTDEYGEFLFNKEEKCDIYFAAKDDIYEVPKISEAEEELFAAIAINDVKKINELIEQGIDPLYVKNGYGLSPYQWALIAGHKVSAEALKDRIHWHIFIDNLLDHDFNRKIRNKTTSIKRPNKQKIVSTTILSKSYDVQAVEIKNKNGKNRVIKTSNMTRRFPNNKKSKKKKNIGVPVRTVVIDGIIENTGYISESHNIESDNEFSPKKIARSVTPTKGINRPPLRKKKTISIKWKKSFIQIEDPTTSPNMAETQIK